MAEPLESHVLTLPKITRAEAERRARETLARILAPGARVHLEVRYYNRPTGESGTVRTTR